MIFWAYPGQLIFPLLYLMYAGEAFFFRFGEMEFANIFPKNIDWELMIEEEDTTTGSQELACTAGACEIV